MLILLFLRLIANILIVLFAESLILLNCTRINRQVWGYNNAFIERWAGHESVITPGRLALLSILPLEPLLVYLMLNLLLIRFGPRLAFVLPTQLIQIELSSHLGYLIQLQGLDMQFVLITDFLFAHKWIIALWCHHFKINHWFL